MGVKVGDKVRSLVTEFDVREGGIYEVETVGSDGAWVIDDVEDDYYLCNDQFEPVAVADSNGNRFKVGDRVKITADEDGCGAGKFGTIVHMPSFNLAEIDVDPPFDGWGENLRHWNVSISKLQPAKLTIRAGGYYRTRDGRKVGPMRAAKDNETWEDTYGNKGAFVAESMESNGHGGVYAADGTWLTADDEYNRHNLIVEWIDEPVAAGGSNSNDTIDDWYFGKTAGYTVPLCAMEDDAPKFKVGDRVEYDDGRTNGVGDIIEVLNESEFDYMVMVESKDARYAYYPDGIGRKFAAANLRLVAPATSGKDTINRIPWMQQADNNVATIADIVRRLEALEAKQPAEPEHCIGDKVTLSATVTGMNKRRVNVVIDGVPQPGGSLAVPPAALTAA